MIVRQKQEYRMKKILFVFAAVTGFSVLAQADYQCTTRAGGRTFTERENTYQAARREVIRECHRAMPMRLDRTCDRNVSCRNIPDARPGLCFVPQAGRWMSSEAFFNYARLQARRSDRCMVANVVLASRSTRLYDDDGRRVTFIRGGTSRCLRLTCARLF